jgi:hypothetical protein
MEITRKTKGKIKVAIHNTVKSGLLNLDIINSKQLKENNVLDFVKGVKFDLKVTTVLENKEIIEIKDKRISKIGPRVD